MKYLTAKDVVEIHEEVINLHELQGLAQNKSIEAIIARVENRIHYGMVDDVFELATCYDVYIAIGHSFNDANKRTAFAAMDICLLINNIELVYDTINIGDMIREITQGKVDETELAQWLRQLAVSNVN